jgi:hypothetical protein
MENGQYKIIKRQGSPVLVTRITNNRRYSVAWDTFQYLVKNHLINFYPSLPS